MSGPIILRSHGLTVGYQQPVLSGIDLELERGQFIALLGPNGAGKTTLLRTLSRHIPPLAGTVELLGQDLARMRAIDLARRLAVCLTDNTRPPLLSVSEFVALGRYPHTGFMGHLSGHDADIVENALLAVMAGDLAGRLVEQLSDGERQKVVLARALAQEPNLMLLDEPTAHLDLKHRVEVMGILRSLCRAKGVTVLAALHDIDIAAKVADRVLLVRAGGVSDYGLPEAVLSGDKVAELYGFDAAEFDSHLGGIEFRGDGRAGRAFVIAGQGRGAPLFRLLSKRGVAIATGVLNEGDLDAYVAAALRATAFVQTATHRPQDVLAAARAVLATCDFVVDSGIAGELADALRNAGKNAGRPCLRLCAAGQAIPADAANAQTKICADLAELAAAIDRLPTLAQREAA